MPESPPTSCWRGCCSRKRRPTVPSPSSNGCTRPRSPKPRVGSIIEIQALRALAHAANGEQSTAIAALTDALALAHAHGHVRVFVDEGPPMAALLGTLLAGQRTGTERRG